MMAVPVWNESFTVKVKRCDEDHKKLFALIQRMHEAIEERKGPDVAQDVLRELDEYTKTHFSAEEALMEQTKYPSLLSHRFQHRPFITKLEQLKEYIETCPSTTPVALVEYLKNWLVRHIKMVDQQYSAHLNANGIQ